MVVAMATTTVVEERCCARWAHEEMTPQRRNDFIAAFRHAEAGDLAFRFTQTAAGVKLWPAVVAAVCLCALWLRPPAETSAAIDHLLSTLACVCGVLALQLWFVASHTAAHAFMLEYDQHAPGSARLHSFRISQLPIYFFAFYHHHHTWDDDWAPFLSYNDATRSRIWDHAGTRGVIASHWVDYSHLPYLLPDGHVLPIPATLLAVAGYALLVVRARYFAPFLVGYELAVLLLPLAHGWQHIPHSRYGPWLAALLGAIESLGLIANRVDHQPHHVHTGDTVYQSFSSSGLYARWVDVWMDRQWDYAVGITSKPTGENEKEGGEKGRRPFDVLLPMTLGTWAAVWLLPNVGISTLAQALTS
jgi:hypothetical protein